MIPPVENKSADLPLTACDIAFLNFMDSFGIKTYLNNPRMPIMIGKAIAMGRLFLAGAPICRRVFDISDGVNKGTFLLLLSIASLSASRKILFGEACLCPNRDFICPADCRQIELLFRQKESSACKLTAHVLKNVYATDDLPTIYAIREGLLDKRSSKSTSLQEDFSDLFPNDLSKQLSGMKVMVKGILLRGNPQVENLLDRAEVAGKKFLLKATTFRETLKTDDVKTQETLLLNLAAACLSYARRTSTAFMCYCPPTGLPCAQDCIQITSLLGRNEFSVQNLTQVVLDANTILPTEQIAYYGALLKPMMDAVWKKTHNNNPHIPSLLQRANTFAVHFLSQGISNYFKALYHKLSYEKRLGLLQVLILASMSAARRIEFNPTCYCQGGICPQDCRTVQSIMEKSERSVQALTNQVLIAVYNTHDLGEIHNKRERIIDRRIAVAIN